MSLIRSAHIYRRITPLTSACFGRLPVRHNSDSGHELVTHTGQILVGGYRTCFWLCYPSSAQYEVEDYRRVRFIDRTKLVNPNFAVKLVDEDPIVVCEQRRVFSDGGGALGHPRVYINLDQPEVSVCGYSGRKFILKKYYNEKEHGKSITYEEYLKEMNPQEHQWPN